ncbi:MAG: hypothetical protein ACFFDI_26735 [Promethearchaeota archaeon]
MASIHTLKRVIIIGSVISIILGILRVIQYGIIQPITGQSISLEYWGNASLDILFFIFGVIAIIFGTIILIIYPSKVEQDPSRAGMHLIVLGFPAGLGANYLGGIIIIIAGILLRMQKPTAE